MDRSTWVAYVKIYAPTATAKSILPAPPMPGFVQVKGGTNFIYPLAMLVTAMIYVVGGLRDSVS